MNRALRLGDLNVDVGVLRHSDIHFAGGISASHVGRLHLIVQLRRRPVHRQRLYIKPDFRHRDKSPADGNRLRLRRVAVRDHLHDRIGRAADLREPIAGLDILRHSRLHRLLEELS